MDQIDIGGDGNLLHFAVIKDLKEHVRILLQHGFVMFLGRIEALNEMTANLQGVFSCSLTAQ